LDRTDELTKLKGENARLKNTIRCQEVELEQKEEKMKNLMNNCVGAPDERFEE